MKNTKSNPPKKTNPILLGSVLILITVISFILFKMSKQISHTVTPSEFITANGSRLTLKNQNFKSIGVNYYDLTHKNNDLIARTFSQLHSIGVTTLRFWLFNDGDPNGLQPAAGVYNKSRFKQADFIIFEAKKNNIKLIPVLINNWADYGGKKQYMKWTGKNPLTEEASFYTDPEIKSIFEKYITYILSRKNTYTGIRYADDPAILAWDIMNEPRGADQIAMNNWLVSIAEFIKQHDRNHLVFSGTEITYNPSLSEDKSSSVCVSDSIDMCSIHLYLYHENNLLYKNYDEITGFLQTQKNYARKINKPLIIEELGIPRDKKPFGDDPRNVMKQIIDDSGQSDLAGYLIWDWADTRTSQFTFTPNGDQDGLYSLSDLRLILF